MPITVYTRQETFERAVAYLGQRYPNGALGPDSFLGQVAGVLADVVGDLSDAVKAADNDAIPGYAVDVNGVIKARCSPEALDGFAHVFGLSSNRGPGLFGRNGATAATGGTSNALGVSGTVVPTGAVLTDPSGTVLLELVSGVTLPMGGTIAISVNALTPGVSGNLPAGTTLRWQSPVAGLAPTCTLTGALAGGREVESDLELLERLLRRLQYPPKGGTANDYRTWAEEATDAQGKDLGIERAYIYPHRSGIGSVDVVPTVGGSGAGRDPGAAKVALLQSLLNARKIATDTVYVVRPRFVTAEKLTLLLLCKPSPRHPYDWDDTASTVTVSGASGTTSLVLLGAAPPPALATAIGNGIKPRIQLLLKVWSPIPFLPRVLSAVNNTPAAGQCTLTLDRPLPVAVGANLVVYAGGPAVEPVAVGVLAAGNSVGPSNQSGYADPLDLWEDKVTIGRIAHAALAAQDADGLRVLTYSSRVGNAVGIQISVGGGPFSGDDFRLFDNVPGQGPQLPEVEGVIVIRE